MGEGKLRRCVLLVFLGCLVSGCAIGNTHRYDLGDATFELESDKTVAVTAVDVRPYVRSGEKTPDFVGLMRGGFGNPFDITTDSGRPLADDVTTSIVKSLKVSNVGALEVTVPPGADVAEARKTLLAADADRFAMLLVREWKSDTYFNTGLLYDLSLRVLQQDGTLIVEKTVSGDDNLGASGVPADARVNTEKAFRQKLEAVFGDPGVVSALQ